MGEFILRTVILGVERRKPNVVEGPVPDDADMNLEKYFYQRLHTETLVVADVISIRYGLLRLRSASTHFAQDDRVVAVAHSRELR